jgi:hypothetical protein
MNRFLFLLTSVAFAFVIGACGINLNINVEKGSGNVITESRQVSGFDRVSLSGIGDVTLVQGSQESLEIEAEDNLVENITTEVRDGTLYINFEEKTIIPTKAVKFHLNMIDIRGIETKGVSNLESSQIQTDILDISISGTGNINIDDLTADSLTINVSGAGSFTAAGQVQEQEVTMSGAGNYNGEDLQSSTANVTITGLGQVSIWATDNLDVTISGTGGVEYYGNPQVNQQISGLGKVEHKGDK